MFTARCGLTKRLSPRRKVLLEKLLVPQSVKKKIIHSVYLTRKFITVFTKAHHLLLSSARSSSPCPKIFQDNYFNITFPSSHRPSKWALTLRFHHQNPVRTSPLPYTCHMSSSSHSSPFDYSNSIWWGVLIMNLLIMQFPLLPCYLIPVRPKYFPKLPNALSLRSALNARHQVSHTYKTEKKL